METKSELTALPASQVSLPVDEPNERNLAGEMGDQRGPARREPCDWGMEGHKMVKKKKKKKRQCRPFGSGPCQLRQLSPERDPGQSQWPEPKRVSFFFSPT